MGNPFDGNNSKLNISTSRMVYLIWVGETARDDLPPPQRVNFLRLEQDALNEGRRPDP